MERLRVNLLVGVAVLGLFSFDAYGIHNLKINNSTAITVTTSDTLHITANFESSGATAKAILYYDTNSNGVLNTGEPWVAKFRMKDGNFADDDGSVNGLTNVIYDPVTMTGKFLLYAEDNGVSDTVAIQVNPIASSLIVSGKINTPSNTAHLFVGVSDTINGKDFVYGDFTDGSGNYSLYLPYVAEDSTMSISAVDMLGVAAPYYMSSQVTLVMISGSQVMNFDLFNVSTGDSTVVTGGLKDDLSSAITDPAQIVGGASSSGYSYGVRRITNTGGQFRFVAPKYNPGYYMSGTSVVDQFYPQYLDPPYKAIIGYGAPACTLNLTVYRTNDSICGTVYKSGSPYRYAQLDLSGFYPNPIGNTYTKTYADGHYVAYVSNSAFLYSVRVAPKNVPQGYIVVEGDTVTAMPGATGVDFHITSVGSEESRGIGKQSIVVQPNPFINTTIVKFENEPMAKLKYNKIRVYDMSGRLVEETMDNVVGKKLGAGIYFIKFRNYKPIKIIKLK